MPRVKEKRDMAEETEEVIAARPPARASGGNNMNVVFVELGENVAKRFLQKIREHVEPAAVRHAHANFLNT